MLHPAWLFLADVVSHNHRLDFDGHHDIIRSCNTRLDLTKVGAFYELFQHESGKDSQK